MAEIACSDGGFSDRKLAKLFGVSQSTIYNWKKDYPKFLESIKKGKDKHDTLSVENDLLRRARGYRFTEVTKEVGKDNELSVTKQVRKEVVPDVTAQIFWLKNRNPDRWRDKRELDVNDKTVRVNSKRFDGEEE